MVRGLLSLKKLNYNNSYTDHLFNKIVYKTLQSYIKLQRKLPWEPQNVITILFGNTKRVKETSTASLKLGKAM